MQKEIIQPGYLLDEKGQLTDTGYARKLLLEYKREAIKANSLKIKEWDYYCVYNQHYAIALTIADNSYMGLMSVSLIDFDNKKETTKSVMTFMPKGKTNLPTTSVQGNVSFKNKKIDISFTNDGTTRRLYCLYPKFKDGQTLEVDIELTDVPTDSLVIVTPYKESKTAFYYNQKINCLKAKGFARISNQKIVFDQSDSFGGLDWGRGVWTYDNVWYWSSASGEVDGHRFGFNLGYGFGDTSAASENMLFYDGIGHKLDRVTFNIPLDSKGKEKYLEPWTFSSSDSRFEMNFVPFINRKAHTNAMIIESDQNQVFGKFSGKAILDDGTVIEIKDFIGFAEKVRNRW